MNMVIPICPTNLWKGCQGAVHTNIDQNVKFIEVHQSDNFYKF